MCLFKLRAKKSLPQYSQVFTLFPWAFLFVRINSSFLLLKPFLGFLSFCIFGSREMMWWTCSSCVLNIDGNTKLFWHSSHLWGVSRPCSLILCCIRVSWATNTLEHSSQGYFKFRWIFRMCLWMFARCRNEKPHLKFQGRWLEFKENSGKPRKSLKIQLLTDRKCIEQKLHYVSLIPCAL